RDEPRIERAPQRLVFEQRGLMLCVQEALEEGGRALWRLAAGEPTREHPLKRLVGERPPLEGLRTAEAAHRRMTLAPRSEQQQGAIEALGGRTLPLHRGEVSHVHELRRERIEACRRQGLHREARDRGNRSLEELRAQCLEVVPELRATAKRGGDPAVCGDQRTG